MALAPPTDISPERLFALLVEPCPTERLSATLEGFALEVRAMPAQAWASAWWAAQSVPEEVRRGRYVREILARCLWSDGSRVAQDDLALLTEVEVRAVANEALDVLARISPTYGRCDWQAWQRVLETGAKHSLNASTGVALAACVDYGHGAVVFRPDRFWGVPMQWICDHHWFCFRAARAAWSDDDRPRVGVRAGKVEMVPGKDGMLVPAG